MFVGRKLNIKILSFIRLAVMERRRRRNRAVNGVLELCRLGSYKAIGRFARNIWRSIML